MTTAQPTIFNALTRWIMRLFIAVIIIVLLIFSVIPLVVSWGVTYWFEEQGVKAEIEHFSLSPVVGRIELSGFKGENDLGDRFELDNLLVDVAVWPLLDKHLIVEKIVVSGLQVDARKTDGQLYLAGLDVAAVVASLAADEAVPEPDVVMLEASDLKAEPALVDVVVEQLLVSDIKVCASSEEGGHEKANLCFTLGEVSLSKPLTVDLGESLVVSSPGQLWLKDVALTDAMQEFEGIQELDVMAFDAFTLTGIELSPQTLQLKSINLDELALLERFDNSLYGVDEPHHFSLKSFAVDDFSTTLTGVQSLNVGQVNLAKMNAFVHRDAAAQLPLQLRIDALLTQLNELLPAADNTELPAESVPDSEPVSASEAISIVVNEITIDDGSRVFVVDQGVVPNVEQRIENITISVMPIDNRQPSSLSNVAVAVQINDFGSIKINGSVQPFSEKMNMEFDVAIDSIDMLPLSPYIERAMQYQIERGQVGNTVTLKITDNDIDAVAVVKLDKFYLQSLEEHELAEGEEQQNLPVGTALNLLRDSNDRIELKLPVSGDVDDPNFSIKHVVALVFRKTLTAAVVNYYTPFGLVNIASAAANALTQLQFEPLVFEGGATELESSHKNRLGQFEDLLQAKPQLSLSFCPTVTQADALALLALDALPEGGFELTPAQTAQLKAYGLKRATEVKRHLIDNNILAGQIILCQPKVNVADLAAPTVAIQI